MREYNFTFSVRGYHETCVAAKTYEEAFNKAMNNYNRTDFGALTDFEAEVCSCDIEELYTYDDLCRVAKEDKNVRRARDTARWQIVEEIFSLTDRDVNDAENPEEEICKFLKENPEYYFDAFGNILAVDL